MTVFLQFKLVVLIPTSVAGATVAKVAPDFTDTNSPLMKTVEKHFREETKSVTWRRDMPDWSKHVEQAEQQRAAAHHLLHAAPGRAAPRAYRD